MKDPLSTETPQQQPPAPAPEEQWLDIDGHEYLHYLGAQNFDTFLQNHDSVLVMFYAPCKYTISQFKIKHFFNWTELIFLLISHENICCGYSLEVPLWGTSNEYPQHIFLWRNKKRYLNTRVVQKVLSLIGFLSFTQVYFKMLHCTWMVCWIADDTRLFCANCFPTDRVISNWNRCSHVHWPIYLLQ